MKNGLSALSPIVTMVALLILFSIFYGGVSNAPLLFIFVISAMVAVAMTPGVPFKERVSLFSRGAGSPDLLLMVWIFMLAGAFAASAKAMGAAEAMVDLTLRFLPALVALMPIAAGLADKTGMVLPLVAAAVVGGAFFGDNLSFISDTTIVSTQSQGCQLRDKFIFNIRMVIPVALVVAVIYVFMGYGATEAASVDHIQWWKVVPYLAVLVCAAAGIDVLVVLALGNMLTCITGVLDGSYNLMGWVTSALNGVMGMSELILISLLAGGIFALIRYNGGLDFMINLIMRRVRSRAGAEWSICALVAFANICTANNTIAILSVGDISKHIAEQFDIDPRRSASLLDTTSCCIQGLLPYGAQLLMASGLAGISALSIVPYLFYPMLLGLVVVLTILVSKH